MSDEDARSGPPPQDQGGKAGEGDTCAGSRREFMKKLPYVAPVIQSFVLADTVYAKKKDKTRGRGRVSDPGQNDPPPPPPPPPGGGGD